MDADEQIETVSTDITGTSTIRKPKETHCKFCALNFYNGSDLDAHLRTKTKCRVQYMKVFKASSFDDLSKRLRRPDSRYSRFASKVQSHRQFCPPLSSSPRSLF